MSILKHGSDLLASTLAALINAIFSTKQVPNKLKMATVKPLFKGKGSEADTANYRPLTIIMVVKSHFRRESKRISLLRRVSKTHSTS